MNSAVSTRATISLEEKTKSQKFINLINGIMEIVDNVSSKLDDGEYLELCNKLRDMYKLKPEDNIGDYLMTELNTNEVIRENINRSAMRVRTKKNEILDDYEKLKTGDYKRCPDCSRVVCKTYFGRHKKNGVCIKTNSTKKLSASTGEVDTAKKEDLICKITAVKHRREQARNAGTSEAGSSTSN